MQKTAPKTPDLLSSFKGSAKDLECRRNAQSGWRNHPLHRSTSSHGRRYQTPKIPFNQPGKGRRYPWLTAFEPTIHWKDATLDKTFQPVIISSLNPKGVQVLSAITEEEGEIKNKDPDSVPYVAIRNIRAQAIDPLEGAWEVSSEMESEKVTLRKTTVASELAKLAADKTKRTYEEMVPEEYRKY